MKQFSWAPDLWIKQVYFWDWSQALGSVVDVEILQVEEENQKVCMMRIMTTAAVDLHSRVGKERQEQIIPCQESYAFRGR